MALGFVSTAILETPTGFAFFSVYEAATSGPESIWSWFIGKRFAKNVISLREFVKVDDKSVALALGDGPGERLAATIRKCCSDGRQLVVGNEELRDVIKSKLVDRNIIILVGLVDRCDTRFKHSAKTIREMGDKLVPDIGPVIKDDRLYAEVVSKILAPVFVEEWHPTKWFPDDVVKKIDAAAAAAAAASAEKKVDFEMYCSMKDCLVKLRLLPGIKARFLKEVKSLADEISRAPKRSYTEVAQETNEIYDDGCLPAGKKLR